MVGTTKHKQAMEHIVFTRSLVDEIKQFLLDGTVPERLCRSDYYKFKKRYSTNEWKLKDKKLYHQEREVIPVEDVPETLDRLYHDPEYMQTSANRFYSRIAVDFAGISRTRVGEYLSTKRVPQMFKKPPKPEIAAVMTYNKLEQMQIDFIDLKASTHANLGFRYVLTCIDHFSKYAWAFPLKTRDSSLAAEKIRELFEQGHVPHVLHADNEFQNAEFLGVCEKFGVAFIHSYPYHPQSNGAIERWNKTLKQAIRKLQTEYQDLTFIDALQKLVSNYNNCIHSAHGMTPKQVYFGDAQTVAIAREKSLQYRQKKIFRGPTQDTNIEPGQYVRVALRSQAEERKKRTLKKQGDNVQWSKEVYTISKHWKPRRKLQPHWYQVENKSQKFSRADILPVPVKTENEVPERPRFDVAFHGRTPKTIVRRAVRKHPYKVEPTSKVREPSKRERRVNVSIFKDHYIS